MKKTIILVFIIAVLFIMSGCVERPETTEFGTLDDMKAALGDTLLYPDVLPDGFKPDKNSFTREYYKSDGASDYHISLRDRDYYWDSVNTEHFWRLNEGENDIFVAYVGVTAYEPTDKDRVYGLTRKSELPKYENLAAGGSVWEINGVAAAYEIDFYRREKKYYIIGHETKGEFIPLPEEEKEKRENVYPEHYDYTAYVLFKRGDILYTVDMQIYGRAGTGENEMREICDNTVKTVITGMLR